jgi:transcriptional regulator
VAGLDLLQGTLDVMILSVLASGSLHGYSIARRIEKLTGEILSIEEGSLYPALYRMERRRLLEAKWGVSETGRRAKFYRLTAAGRKQLERERMEWRQLSTALSRVLAASVAGTRS